jgi:hypothetical protein
MSDEFHVRHSPPVFSRPANPAMSESASAAWNEWAALCVAHAWKNIYEQAVAEFVAEYLRGKLDTFAETLGAEVAQTENALRRDLVARIEELETELGSLRADLTLERSVARSGVYDLPNWRRKAA